MKTTIENSLYQDFCFAEEQQTSILLCMLLYTFLNSNIQFFVFI